MTVTKDRTPRDVSRGDIPELSLLCWRTHKILLEDQLGRFRDLTLLDITRLVIIVPSEILILSPPVSWAWLKMSISFYNIYLLNNKSSALTEVFDIFKCTFFILNLILHWLIMIFWYFVIVCVFRFNPV